VPTLHTVGHSTREAAEFRRLLEHYGVDTLVDVRQFPGSRRFPHFGQEALAASLAEAAIQYLHDGNLGGRRRAREDSKNTYWRNVSFRAFADYMASGPFQDALTTLIELAGRQHVTIMCAEAVPWRCHRWLISDALVTRGVDVVHIVDREHSQPHVLNPNARVERPGILTYPAAEEPQPAQRSLGFE
jgi:uncharacterized protein (DUF488 family)